MKKLYFYSIISVVILSLIGCTQREDVKIPNPTVKMVLTAATEGDETKALMGEINDDDSRSVLWEPGDSIRVMLGEGDNSNYLDTALFVNITAENSKIATFEGEITNNYRHQLFASYPYSMMVNKFTNEYWNGTNWIYDRYFTIRLSQTQIYRENNFAKESFPMLAYQELLIQNGYQLNDPLEFKNLCGVLALNIVGDITVRSITMTAKDSTGRQVALSGLGQIKRDSDSLFTALTMFPVRADEYTTMAMAEGISTVTLECPDVELDPDIPTPFHIVLPPATYSSFTLTIATTDGRIMLVNVDKELVINRSKAKHTTPLTYVETVAVDLSNRGTSNCYIVPEAGVYKFRADVIGNGNHGIIGGANFHTSDPSISPEIVKILWNDNSAVSGVGLNTDEGYISFTSTGNKGNALIAAMDADSTILWSWHIWCTDKPKEHTYVNYEDESFIVLDRNIGATRADRGTGEEWRESVGLHYQWGRKDPFTSSNLNRSDNTFTIEKSIKYPTYLGPWRWLDENANGYYMNYSQLWSDSLKTIYDPCPVGYKVAPRAIWTGFSKKGLSSECKEIDDYNVSGSFDNGWNFKYDGTNTAWYPATSNDGFSINPSGNVGKYWSSTSYSTNEAYNLYFHYGDEFSHNMTNYSESSGYIKAVRCSVDEGFIDRSLPTITIDKIDGIGYESARVTATVSVPNGVSEVTGSGLVWSTLHNPTIESSHNVAIDTLDGEFSYDIIGLDDFTTYYVRAYATNANGTQYSEEKSFTTNYNGPIINLSESGTANCYIVPPTADHYSIDLSVIGNGSKGIIDTANFHTADVSLDPANVKIIWAIKYDNYYGTSSTSELLSFREFNQEKKTYHFVPTGEEGNILLAAVNENDEIIWSWHLWITDEPKEHNYINHEGKIYTVMDRNIGATRADRGSGEQWRESSGFVYQWGRKDPFHDGIEQTSNTPFLIYESILYPTYISASWDWVYHEDPVDRKYLWSSKTKTIYDPCPVGYKVAPKDTWTGFTTTGEGAQKKIYINMSGNWDKGYNFKYDGTNTAWYPNTMYAYWTPWWQENSGGLWSGDSDTWDNRAHYMDYYYNNDMELSVNISSNLNSDIGYGRAVRCVIDSDHHDVAFPYVSTLSVDNITSNSADASATLVSEGIDSVTERGFVYGKQENPTIANTKVTVDTEGSMIGNYNTTITALEPGTTYYIRAYATNGHGTSYGKSIMIRTKDGGSSEKYDRDEEDYEW
ncbi:MAG: hypothetical protein IKW65_04945 [Bacteroidales bacterium]|nr:hypothetical protein [Bacteroidales bacterium]